MLQRGEQMRNFAIYELDGMWQVLVNGKLVYVGRTREECWTAIKSGFLDEALEMCKLMCN